MNNKMNRREFLETAALGAGILLAGGKTMAEERLDQIDWRTQREALFARLSKWCGDIPKGGNLNPAELWRREYRTHTEIKVAYDGEPGERIPAYLLLPRNPLSTPAPAVFAAHQCACQCDVGKEQVVGKCIDWPDQAYGLELVREGFVVLAPDANKIGERYDPTLRKSWETAHDEQTKGRCCTAPGGPWGPIRWKPVYDVMRGIDFLCQCERVDHNKIGMIGHSLGADTTIWTMPFEQRISAAAISGGGLMIEGAWLPYGIPYVDILRLIAPRPFFEFTGKKDYGVNWCLKGTPSNDDQCMERKRRSHALGKETYSMAGKKDFLGYMELDCSHSFPKEARTAAYAWLKKHLTEG